MKQPVRSHVNRGAKVRRKPLVICLGLALGMGGGSIVAGASAETEGDWATRHSAPLNVNTKSRSNVDSLGLRPAPSVASHAPPHRATGANIPVTNCNDEGAGSLRDAVQNLAVSGDTVDMRGLACSTITLTSGAIATPLDDLSIIGPGTDMNGMTILASHDSQIFIHLGSGTLTLANLTAMNGGKYQTGDSDAKGGCVYSYGHVSLLDAGIKYCVAESSGGYAKGGGVYARLGIDAASSTIAGNEARSDSLAGRGGGVYTPGALLANYSWFRGNSASSPIYSPTLGAGGALMSVGDVRIANSTISGNSAGVWGGAGLAGTYATRDLEIADTTICDNYSSESSFGSGLEVGAPIMISNSTITGNVARNSSHNVVGAGIYLAVDSVARLQSTIVSGNSFYDGSTFFPDDIGTKHTGALVGGANNLVGHSTVPLPLDTVITSDPRLGSLTTGNGGPTPTMAPLPDSPAINRGNNIYGGVWDQRGPGFPRVIGPVADIGAVESDALFSNGFD